MTVGLAADHGGFDLKENIKAYLMEQGYTVKDFGAHEWNNDDDYPDFVIPLAKAISDQEIERGVAICGSGVGASIAANKIHNVRAALIHENFSAHQGVEDDNMNMLCMGGRVTGYASARELVDTFLKSKFSGLARHMRRLNKVALLEK